MEKGLHAMVLCWLRCAGVANEDSMYADLSLTKTNYLPQSSSSSSKQSSRILGYRVWRDYIFKSELFV